MNSINNATGRAPLRPVFHFTPASNWINDPNGLVYYAGEYHLFYQYHPDSPVWGPMHWGHAVSRDLVHWEELPMALYPDELGAIFSGSAVIDWHNTAGFGHEAMIAFFTHDAPVGQRQSLAYSTDKGRTWTKYANNPVIDMPPGEKDFRDPKVFWYTENGQADHWVMLLAVQDSIWFYTSPNLTTWTFVGEFGEGHGVHDGVWETPDLFKLRVDDGPVTRWVLVVGVGQGATVDRQGTQYFVGRFDGVTFYSENSPTTELWADHGPDFYAAQGWNEAPDGRKVWLAWMNNWIYANQIPIGTWRGVMTLPRELSLTLTPAGVRLVQQPVRELETMRGAHYAWQDQAVLAGEISLGALPGAALELVAEFAIDRAQPPTRFGLHLAMGEEARTTIGYAVAEALLFVDRTQAGESAFNPAFAGVYQAPLSLDGNVVRLHILVDQTSVEVFGNHGVAVLTAQIFPAPQPPVIQIFAQEGNVALTRLDVWQLVV